MTRHHLNMLGVFALLCAALGTAFAFGEPKPVLDAMHFEGQPSLIDRGSIPLYVAYEGILNRATEPEAGNCAVGRRGAGVAVRRVVRDALDIERPGILQARWNVPPAYDAVVQPVCIDVESIAPLYSEKVDDPDRRRAVRWLCWLVDNMRDEAAGHGRTVSIGAYAPLVPFANDPAARAASEADWKPYLDRLDVAYIDVYPHKHDLGALNRRAEERISNVARLMPGKPIVPMLSIHYGSEAEPSIRYTLVNRGLWTANVRAILRMKGVTAIAMWGGTIEDLDPSANPDGTKRWPWSIAEPYFEAASLAASRN